MTSPRVLSALSWQDTAAMQAGVLSRQQALMAGMSHATWNWFLTSGRWRQVVPGAAITHSGEPSEKQVRWVAVLHAGEGGALTGDAALVQRGFKGLSSARVDAAVPWPRNVVDQVLPDGRALHVHGVRGLARWVQPLPEPTALTFPASLLHAAAWCKDDRGAEWRVASAVQQRLTTPALVRACLDQMPRLPRRALLRSVLADVEAGAEAGSELLFLRFCRKHRLPSPDELQVLVRADGKRYVDARYVRQRVFVELDGAHHRLVAQWDADALRSLALAVATRASGETLIRLTKGNLRHDGDTVAHLLRELLT